MLATGTQSSPYKIVSPIGAGEMGERYRARDTRLGRDVAVKMMPASLAREPERVARFTQEARAAAAHARLTRDTRSTSIEVLRFALVCGGGVISVAHAPVPGGFEEGLSAPRFMRIRGQSGGAS